MDIRIPLIGLVVGVLVGLTGVGGGAITTPLLVLLGLARPIVAVGTDLLMSVFTKAVGAAVHYRQKTVDLRIAGYLALGSIPGSLIGAEALGRIGSLYGQHAVDQFVVRALGLALILVSTSMLIRPAAARHPWLQRLRERLQNHQAVSLPLAGFLVGIIVAMTSVGSGSLVLMLLVALYPHMPLNKLVGSDILHAGILVGVAGLAHTRMGNVDVPLLLSLLLGSIPGVWIGSRFTVLFSDRALRLVLGVLLLGVGLNLLTWRV